MIFCTLKYSVLKHMINFVRAKKQQLQSNLTSYEHDLLYFGIFFFLMTILQLKLFAQYIEKGAIKGLVTLLQLLVR